MGESLAEVGGSVLCHTRILPTPMSYTSLPPNHPSPLSHVVTRHTPLMNHGISPRYGEEVGGGEVDDKRLSSYVVRPKKDVATERHL